MRPIFLPVTIAILLAFAITATLVDASTSALAFTRSYLIANESDSSAVRTFSHNSFLLMPGLYISGYGEASMSAKSDDIGVMILDQSINFSNSNTEYSGVVSSHVEGRNLTELNISVSSMTATKLQREGNLSIIKSASSGLGLADPGIGNYTFYLTGGHYVNIDSSDMPLAYKRPLASYEFSFQEDDIALNEPVDYIDQNVDLIYRVSPDYEQSYVGYDFTRTIEDDGVTCQSEMDYGWVSDSE